MPVNFIRSPTVADKLCDACASVLRFACDNEIWAYMYMLLSHYLP